MRTALRCSRVQSFLLAQCKRAPSTATYCVSVADLVTVLAGWRTIKSVPRRVQWYTDGHGTMYYLHPGEQNTQVS